MRSRVVQVTEAFISDATALMPELGAFRDTMERSRRGALFGAETSERVRPMIAELVRGRDIRRIEIFWVIGALAEARDVRELTSARYLPDPSGFMSTGINEVLADNINHNLTEPFGETDLARIAGLSTGAFSRSFRRHTGLALVQFITRLRVNFACNLLMENEELRITEVCFASGFNNLSNFNRQFLKLKGTTPSRSGHSCARISPRVAGRRGTGQGILAARPARGGFHGGAPPGEWQGFA